MNAWDLSLLHQINTAWSHPVLDWLMPALSAIEAWLPLIIVAVLLTAWRGGKRARIMLLGLGVAIALGDGLVSNTLKKTVGRVRPRDALAGITIAISAPLHPPSCVCSKSPWSNPANPVAPHAASPSPPATLSTCFAVATVIACFYRRAGWLMYLLAAAVAYSRVYCGRTLAQRHPSLDGPWSFGGAGRGLRHPANPACDLTQDQKNTPYSASSSVLSHLSVGGPSFSLKSG